NAMSTTQRRTKPVRPRSFKGQSFAFFGKFSIWPSYHPGPPADVARRLGATIRKTVDEKLDFLVLGDQRGTGRAEARKKAEKLQTLAQKAGKKGKHLRPQILDEASFRELVQVDVSGKRFAFYGGFACAPEGFADDLLTRLVNAAGGVVQAEVDEELD